jgi:tripartite-type tricarboxylate transporter receptor subunit TctC
LGCRQTIARTGIAFACLLMGNCTSAAAADFPVHPLRLILPYAPGGNADTMARLIAQRLGDNLGQQIVVDNRPGANNAADTLAESPLAGSGVGAPVI